MSWGEGSIFRMDVHKSEHLGYLYFLFFEMYIAYAETIPSTTFSELSHHSLYRVTLEELERLTDFAEGLEVITHDWHGHTAWHPIELFQMRALRVWDNLVYFFDRF